MTGSRLVGIDLARFVALVGMMGAHLAASQFSYRWLDSITSGFPSTLFAVLGGFGVTFATRRYLQAGHVAAATASTIGRGALVFLFGFFLEYLPNDPIAVILMFFGVTIALSAAFLRAPSWVLAAFATALALVTPNMLAFAAKNEVPAEGTWLHGPASFVARIFLTGNYPVLTWLTYLLVGMILARWVLRSRQTGKLLATSTWLTLGGAAVGGSAWATGQWYLRTKLIPQHPNVPGEDWLGSMHGHPPLQGWDAIFLVSPHSGSTIDILRTGGVAVALIGLCLLVTLPWKTVPRWLRPAVAAGSAPLTIYVLHLLVTSLALTLSGGLETFWAPAPPWWIHWWFFWQLALVLLVGWVLSKRHQRGPLEVLTSDVARNTADLFIRPAGEESPNRA